MGRWREVQVEFVNQGGQSGTFELRDGQIIRIEWCGLTPMFGP